MKYRTAFSVISLLTSSLLVSPLTYGSDSKRKSIPESDKQVLKSVENEYSGAGKRVKKRSQARGLQETGQEAEKKVEQVSIPLDFAGKIVSMGASATGDPYAKAGAAGLKVTIEAVKALGIGIAKTITITGRYMERAQEILSNAEVILEDLQKSIDKKAKLQKEMDILLNVEKSGQASDSSSRLKQLGTGVKNLAKSAEIKIRQAADIITNDKAQRGQRIEAIRAELKVANENYAENLRLLQIVLMQDTLKEIDKKLNIENTIAKLEESNAFYTAARGALSTSKSKQKKQLAKIESDQAANNRELIYYLKYQRASSETREDLEKKRVELVKKVDELTELSNRGDTIYLQNKQIELDSQVNRSVIVNLYKQIDDIKSQLETLNKVIPPKAVPPLASPPPLETAKNTNEPVQKKPIRQTTPTGNTLTKESIIEGRKALRPQPPPSIRAN